MLQCSGWHVSYVPVISAVGKIIGNVIGSTTFDHICRLPNSITPKCVCCPCLQTHMMNMGLQAAEGGPAGEGSGDAAALQAHLDSAMQAGLIQMNGLDPSRSGLGGPLDPARDGSQSAGRPTLLLLLTSHPSC